jgi:hypothetical protein
MQKMAEKNLVEETLIQIQNLEETINENAKEILASTMKEEISELVKESMKEQTDEQVEDIDLIDVDDDDNEDESEIEISGDDMDDMDDADDITGIEDMGNMNDFGDDETIDLTDASDDEVLKVFKAMSADDEITVTKDGDYIHLVDEPEDNEYLIQTESEENELEESWSDEEDELEETIYEVEIDESDENELEESWSNEEDELEETIYEVEIDESDEDESDDYELSKNMMESKKMMSKPKVGKGAKTGSASKFSYKKSTGGFKEKMKQGTKGVGMGKAKFEFKEEETLKMPSRTGIKLSKEEAKEAARTYGTGWRKGALPKGARAGQETARLNTESVNNELETLRTKNEEYRKALNLFRDKLNEVAIFNSNLAYATRLFTEHSTSKQEKINILRRFDSADTIKESKALYKTIKDELSTKEGVKFMTESVDRKIDIEPQSGSAVSLIESKTYENPQFLRMKDIMQKLIK